MLQTFKTKTSLLVLTVFTFFTLWWVYIAFFLKTTDSPHNLAFTDSYGVIALIGGIVGLFISRKWGGYRSLMGRSILFFALGLLLQEFGQLSYSTYYYVFHVEVPYPSIGDIGYFGSIPIYIIALLNLAKASGVSLSLKRLSSKIVFVLVPLIILSISYYVFLRGYTFEWSSPLAVVLDFGYPLGQAIYISIAILIYILSRGILGGIMRNKVLFILVALVVQYVADFMFLYKANRDTWYAAGPNDYTYLIAYLLMTLALINLGRVVDRLRNGEAG